MPSVSEALVSMDYGPAPESTAAVMDWLKGRSFGHFIDGKFTEPGETFAVIAPFDGAELARVSQGGASDMDAAVAAASRAQPSWAGLGGHGRARHLYALARLLQKRERLFSVLESLNNGKPIREARDVDVPLAVRHFYHHAGWAELVDTQFPHHRPHGVCGQIIPWNFPLLMLAWKVAPALAAGNTVVLKPAEYTPLTALMFAELCIEAGLPAGVVNIVTGDGRTGAALVDAQVDKIAFTGSTEVGRLIRRATAGTGKALTLELGGKSPFVVFDGADIDAAVEGVVDAIWFNQGEVCCAGSRLLVQESVAGAFTRKLKARMQTLRTGDPLDKSTDIGAVVHPTQAARIMALVGQAVTQGAELFTPGTANGCLLPPMLLTGLGAANVAMQEEIFGPVAAMMTFRTPAEAVELANNTRYGLAASLWCENITTVLDIAAQVKAGVVWINGTNMFDANAPFGGMRESGFGREGAHAGMLAYLAAPKVAGAERSTPARLALHPGASEGAAIDRTRKLYIGGAQKRADGGASFRAGGILAPLGNRKDIRNAVEAAHKAGGWSRATGHNRAQVLYFLAENLAAREAEFTALYGPDTATAIRRCFYWAAWADKFDGRVHSTQSAHVTLAMNEAFGVMGLICPDEAPLLGFLSTLLPAIAMGNRVVAVPSQSAPGAALDLVQVMETSDLPGGVVNIVTGDQAELGKVLAQHDDVAALWAFAPRELCTVLEREAAGNLKPVWCEWAMRAWSGAAGQGEEFLQNATQRKTIWVPYGA